FTHHAEKLRWPLVEQSEITACRSVCLESDCFGGQQNPPGLLDRGAHCLMQHGGGANEGMSRECQFLEQVENARTHLVMCRGRLEKHRLEVSQFPSDGQHLPRLELAG